MLSAALGLVPTTHSAVRTRRWYSVYYQKLDTFKHLNLAENIPDDQTDIVQCVPH
jgi:hypothetical protein